MSKIQVSSLAFSYDTSGDPVFDGTSFQLDTDWKLGLIGRNGKGKTTLLKLLMGEYDYSGTIQARVNFDYFPYSEKKEEGILTVGQIEHFNPDYELWRVLRELSLLHVEEDCLYRPYETLSFGERTKVMLAVLFSKENEFLLVDEPTNHLDQKAREEIKGYLCQKKGFILVSHDRWLLDACIDHVLVLNRSSITVGQGNFSSWWENKQKMDQFGQAEHEKLTAEIKRLEKTQKQAGVWADKIEGQKIGFNPVKVEKSLDRRAYVAEKSRRMQQRRKNLVKRQDAAIEEKKGLLQDVEVVKKLKLFPLRFHKEVLAEGRGFSLSYGEKTVFSGLDFCLKNGDCLALMGENGSGKSSFIKYLLKESGQTAFWQKDGADGNSMRVSGSFRLASGLTISYVPQDAEALSGTLSDYSRKKGLDKSLFLALLRQLDFRREQFEKRLEEYSAGQKKKVLLAASLLKPAHLYIWDEPFNYIDIFSRMQLMDLLLEFQPTMILVEHDGSVTEKIKTNILKF